LLLAHLVLSLSFTTLSADNWPQWRGPTGDGVSRETSVPVTWSESHGVRWKAALPEWGTSTPAIWENAIFVTSHVENRDLVLLRLDADRGQGQWTRRVGTGSVDAETTIRKSAEKRGRQQFHHGHNLASPSPITDGKIVVVHFGDGELAAYDFDGQQLWHRDLQSDYGPYTIWWGHANSPVLFGDLVISVCMQDSCDDLQQTPAASYVVAHDKRSGEPVWKTMRMTGSAAEHCDAYTTPLLRSAASRTEVVVMGGEVLDAYDPITGQKLWQIPEMQGNRVIPTPVARAEWIYAIRGMRGPLVALRIDGQEPVSTKDIAWQFDQGTSDSPSPVLAGNRLLMITNNGIAHCFRADSGELLWKERLPGEYRASPVVADGKVYFLNMEGLATVVAASDDFALLSKNQLDANTIASPAFADGRIYIRSHKWLYCLEP
jgi:outer membrane protein assembly factor BamB